VINLEKYIGKPRTIAALLALGTVLTADGLHAASSPPAVEIDGREYIRMARLAKRRDLKLDQSNPDMLALTGGEDSLILYPGRRRMEFSGVEIWLNGWLKNHRREWYISEVDERDILDPLIDPDTHLKDYKCETVVLDPGHGGRDPGAVSPSGLYEKDLALDISLRCARILQSKGVEVLLTREHDKYLQLGFRPRIASNRDADAFVSIHLNAAPSAEASGIETYRLTASGFPSVENAGEKQFDPSKYNGNGYNGANTLLGFHIQKHLCAAAGGIDRGLRHARYLVLKSVKCPAVLVECGFLSNTQEENLLNSSEHRQKLAAGIADGILAYRQQIAHARLLAEPIDPGA